MSREEEKTEKVGLGEGKRKYERSLEKVITGKSGGRRGRGHEEGKGENESEKKRELLFQQF